MIDDSEGCEVKVQSEGLKALMKTLGAVAPTAKVGILGDGKPRTEEFRGEATFNESISKDGVVKLRKQQGKTQQLISGVSNAERSYAQRPALACARIERVDPQRPGAARCCEDRFALPIGPGTSRIEINPCFIQPSFSNHVLGSQVTSPTYLRGG